MPAKKWGRRFPTGATCKILNHVQKQHLLNVPYENLDIHSGTEINLDVDLFYLKMAENNRGGFCYELNGAFNEQYFAGNKLTGDTWNGVYIFKSKMRNLCELSRMCEFQQTSPDSHFTKGKLCSLMTENGR